MKSKGRSVLKVLLLAQLFFFLLLIVGACQGGKKEGEPGGKEPETKLDITACKKFDKQTCNVWLDNKSAFCAWKANECVPASSCGDLNDSACLDAIRDKSTIKGLQCRVENNKCQDAFDCTKITSSDDCSNKMSIESDASEEKYCLWLKRGSIEKCYSLPKTGHFTISLYGSDQALCAYPTRGDIPAELECWGQGSSGRLPVDLKSYAGQKPAKVLFGDDFGCAETDDKHVVCWGNNAAVVGHEPAEKIKSDSLQVNKHVACAIIDDATHEDNVKCWGDLTQIASLIVGLGLHLKMDNAADPGFVHLQNISVPGHTANPLVKAKKIALGSDFLCVTIMGGQPAFGFLQDQLFCSGKTNFGESKNIPNMTFNIQELSAGKNFVCAVMHLGINKNKGYCFRQPTNNASFDDTFVFSGNAQFSPEDFSWISAQAGYVCAYETAPQKKLKCFGATDPLPFWLEGFNGTNFSNMKSSFVFGPAYMCGVLDSGKIKCLGDAQISDHIPKLLGAL